MRSQIVLIKYVAISSISRYIFSKNFSCSQVSFPNDPFRIFLLHFSHPSCIMFCMFFMYKKLQGYKHRDISKFMASEDFPENKAKRASLRNFEGGCILFQPGHLFLSRLHFVIHLSDHLSIYVQTYLLV